MKPGPALLGNPVTDEFQHQFMGLVTPTDIDGAPNPYFDDLDGDDVPDGRTAIARVHPFRLRGVRTRRSASGAS